MTNDVFLSDSRGDLWFLGRKHKVRRLRGFITRKSRVNGGQVTNRHWGRNAFSKRGKPGKSIGEIEQVIQTCNPSFYLIPIHQMSRATGLEL